MTEAMVLIEVDPGELVVGANVRLDPRLDKEFVDSIRERGVLEPIVYEAATNREHWRRLDDGTRRYLRFIESQGYELSDVERRACGEDVTKRVGEKP